MPYRTPTHNGRCRILLELGSNDDPMWKYFDGQHAFILKRMKDIRASSMANVQGNLAFLGSLVRWCSPFTAVYDRTMPRVSGPDDLTDRLTSELRICVPALESKQAEATIGNSRSFVGSSSPLTPTSQLRLVTTSSGR